MSLNLQYGPGRNFVRQAVRLAWPIMQAGKRLSNLPFLKWLIYPFFMRPYNEVSSIPLNIEVQRPENVAMPRRVVKRLLANVDELFIFDECICRRHNKVSSPPQDIGCMALGPAIRRIHPSHGRMAAKEEAFRHVDRAAEAGLSAAYTEAEGRNPPTIVLNFGEVSYINSTGIALIVGLLARARQDRRQLLACGPSDHYRELFEITRLSDFMTTYADEAAAVADAVAVCTATL